MILDNKYLYLILGTQWASMFADGQKLRCMQNIRWMFDKLLRKKSN